MKIFFSILPSENTDFDSLTDHNAFETVQEPSRKSPAHGWSKIESIYIEEGKKSFTLSTSLLPQVNTAWP